MKRRITQTDDNTIAGSICVLMIIESRSRPNNAPFTKAAMTEVSFSFDNVNSLNAISSPTFASECHAV